MDTPRVYAYDSLVDQLPRIGNWKTRRIARVKRIVIHRCSVSEASKGKLTDSPRDTATFFVAAYGWPSHPYHFQVDLSGQVFQTAKLSDLTHGVKFFNATSIHVKVTGNFTREVPTRRQFQAAAGLTADLIGYLHGAYPGSRIAVRGHSPETTKLRFKVCPGKNFNMDQFRRLVERERYGDRAGLEILPTDEDWFQS